VLRYTVCHPDTLKVSKLFDTGRPATVRKRRQGEGFGGIAGLEKKRRYRDVDTNPRTGRRYGMVFDKSDMRRRGRDDARTELRERSRSPEAHHRGSWPDIRGPRQNDRGFGDRDRDSDRRYDRR